MQLINLLATTNYLVINKFLIQKLGIEASLMLSELCNAYSYHLKNETLTDGAFYHTVEAIENNICLSKYKQKQAVDILIENELVTTFISGIPAKRHFLLNEEKIAELLDMTTYSLRSKNLTTGGQKIRQQEVKEFDTNNTKEKNTKKKNIEQSKNSHKTKTSNYLENLPEADLVEFCKNFNCDRPAIIDKAETLLDYCLSHNKWYADPKAFLRNALRRDYGKRMTYSSQSSGLSEDMMVALHNAGAATYKPLLNEKEKKG